MSFIKNLKKRWKQKKYICVGLDSDFSKIPSVIKREYSIEESIVEFNKAIIDATFDIVCAYKMQSSYYEAEGSKGIRALRKTVKYIHKN